MIHLTDTEYSNLPEAFDRSKLKPVDLVDGKSFFLEANQNGEAVLMVKVDQEQLDAMAQTF